MAFSERHAVEIAAPPERVWTALVALTPAQTPLARRLMRLRGIRLDPQAPLLERMRALGFEPALEERPRLLVLHADGRPWRPGGGRAGPAEPGSVALELRFELEPIAGGTRLVTETVVRPADARARRAFRPYWLVVRPASGLVRRSWLRGVAKAAARAEPARPLLVGVASERLKQAGRESSPRR